MMNYEQSQEQKNVELRDNKVSEAVETVPNIDNIDTEGDIIDKEVSLSLSGHLEELRRRIFYCLAAWTVASCLAYAYADLILQKVRELGGSAFTFVYTGPTEAFMAFIKLSMALGLVAVLPVILYHIAAFVNPALTRRERRLLFSLTPVCLVLFCVGLVFAWFVALPVMWRFFLSFQTKGIVALWTIGEVVGFASGLLLICGCVFEIPVFLIGAVKVGIISYDRLAKARRVSYFVILVLTAVITPTPDAFTCLVVAGPIIALFELSLLCLRFIK
ncbi:MAG: twin-arginine translocase subunit TatC [Candidatus Bruticola sp.]